MNTEKNAQNQLIQLKLQNCSIGETEEPIIRNIDLVIHSGESWLITGSNGSGKSALATALEGNLPITPGPDGLYFNTFSGKISLVSFEQAAALISEERQRDDSDFIEGGVDKGRTPRELILAAGKYSGDLENHPAIQQCAITSILDRGLKYLSTGEIRRTLLARALIQEPALIIFDEPFEGLDSASRATVSGLFNTLAANSKTSIIVILDDPRVIPEAITHVLELEHRSVNFSGIKSDFLLTIQNRQAEGAAASVVVHQKMAHELSLMLHRDNTENLLSDTLVIMKDVSVEWSGKTVLKNLSWTLIRGQHTLVRGPNGSGKTTFLELITGDNPQVFRNDIWLFGKKRGSGETIWELKEKMGIVSYRLHLEYRMVGDIDIEGVLISGLHDTIGLYQGRTAHEQETARHWLTMASLENRASERFSTLSWGEQRAVLILRAAIKCPPLLILDEPCHGLDGSHRQLILDLLQSIAESGKTTLLHVTHDVTEVLPCEKSILELRPGEQPMYQILHAEQY